MTVLPHEDVEVHRLERMPLSVRRKLLESGAALDDTDWRGLPRLARQRLVDVRVDSAVERRAFRQLVGWLRETFLGATEGSASSRLTPRRCTPGGPTTHRRVSRPTSGSTSR